LLHGAVDRKNWQKLKFTSGSNGEVGAIDIDATIRQSINILSVKTTGRHQSALSFQKQAAQSRQKAFRND